MEDALKKVDDRKKLVLDAILVVVLAVSMRATNNMVATTIPTLASYDLFFSNFEVGIISALLGVSTLVSTSIINVRMGPRSRRPIFLISTIGSLVTLAGFYFSSDITIWGLAILSGLAYGIIFPNVITYAMSQGDGQFRERILSLYSVSLSLGLVIGPSIETYALQYINYRLVFLLFMPITAIGVALSFKITFEAPNNYSKPKSSLKNRGLIAAILNITTYNLAFAAIVTFIILFAEHSLHINNPEAYLLFIFFFSVSFATRLAMSIRPFKFIKKPIIISALITAGALFTMPFTNQYYQLAIAMALLGIPHGTIFPLSTIMISRATEPQERNTANSYFMAYNNVLFITVPVIFGYISNYIDEGFSFALLGIPALASCAALLSLFGKDRKIFYR